MSNVIDVNLLIAEVRKKPAIWNGRQKGRPFVLKMWQDIAENFGVDVNLCKRKWKNLRDAYHAEVRRSQRRIQRDKFLGLYEPNITNYKSKWIHFSALSFLDDIKHFVVENDNNWNSDESNQLDEFSDDDMLQERPIQSFANIKLESDHVIESHPRCSEDDDERANDLLFEEFQNIATPKAATRLSATFSLNNACEKSWNLRKFTPNPSNEKAFNCRCSQKGDDQVHFLQDLGKEEQKLMQSTRKDITRCNKLDHIGDFDYNFLVSFLPQMKRMSELQNLQFRSKICEIALNILATSPSQDATNTNINSPKCDLPGQSENCL